MTIPGGSWSINARPAAALVLAVLSMVNVRVLRPPNGTELGEKPLVNPGSSMATAKSAVAGPLLPAPEVRSPDTFVWVPGVLLVTSAEMVHVAKDPILPSLNVMVPPPSGTVTIPSQVDVTFAGAAIVTPAGRLSVKARSRTPTAS